ncbi:MAG: KEOPS complex subunit Pcc1 [Candidatus Aenigmatarchaeota archaeon]|nr:hypothetical protein [Candidatus Aenigmarchaeota archaeon]
MKALIEIETDDPKTVADALRPDIEAKHFSVELRPSKDKLNITIHADSIGKLTAGINSCLRLVRAAKSAQEVK